MARHASSRASDPEASTSASVVLDGLELGVLVQAGLAVLAPQTRSLVAAKRHAGTGHTRSPVDAHPPGPQRARDVKRGTDVLRHDMTVEPIQRVVGDRDGLVVAVEADHDTDRPEDLLLCHRPAIVDAG